MSMKIAVVTCFKVLAVPIVFHKCREYIHQLLKTQQELVPKRIANCSNDVQIYSKQLSDVANRF